MRNLDKQVNKDLFTKLKSNKIPTRMNAIYLSDGLYLTEDGDIIEENELY